MFLCWCSPLRQAAGLPAIRSTCCNFCTKVLYICLRRIIVQSDSVRLSLSIASIQLQGRTARIGCRRCASTGQQSVFRSPAFLPCFRSLNFLRGEYPIQAPRGSTFTFRFLTRWFLIRLANHSPAVTPPVWNLAFSGFLAASATISLKSAIGSSTIDFPGRVKNTRDQRVCLHCSPGGWLDSY